MLFIKERKLKANHNIKNGELYCIGTECCLSKNANWKQITTNFFLFLFHSKLNVVYQRTQIESKSQLIQIIFAKCFYWMLFIKERKLKANHNFFWLLKISAATECCLSKNANWKQITTFAFDYLQKQSLNVVYQRTQIESKSQPKYFFIQKCRYWMLFIKERKLKANHNADFINEVKQVTECCLSKNANWKQITTLISL